MPWVLEMEFTPEQAEAIRLADISAGQVTQWYMKQNAALDFPADWLPKYGRVAVELMVTKKDGAGRTEQYPAALPDPVPHSDKTPEQFAQPVIPGVVKARLYHSNAKPGFLPIVNLADRDTRHAVERYLEGCPPSEVKRWLEGVGRLEFMEDVSMSGKPDDKVHKYRFTSRAGYDTIVDITAWGIHIVY